MLRRRLHQCQTHATTHRTSEIQHIFNVMKIIWIYVVLTCVALAICENLPSTSDTTTLKPLGRKVFNDDDEDDHASANFANHRMTSDIGDDADEDDPNIPVLPPIILLDFTDDSDNNSTSDEKSKRTINNELGYGYLKNNLLSGKFNYYFPGGKSGTAVSIEESITPFEPKTIVETFKLNTERSTVPSSTPKPQSNEQVDQPIAQPWTATFPSSQQIFGQRTKLRKAPPNTFAYQYFSTTSQPDFNNHNLGYTTPKPFSNRYNIHTSTPGYNSKYNVVGLTPPSSGFMPESPTTPRTTLSDDPTIFNLPRYTVENGIKYENKIVWKYPDGRIANNPATSYVNSYTEFSNPQVNKEIKKNPQFSMLLTQQSPPFLNSGLGKFRSDIPTYSTSNTHQSSRLPAEPITNIHSQRPAQFPNDQESNFSPHPSGNSQVNSFDFSYQDNFGLRQRGNAPKVPMRNEQTLNRATLKLSADTDNPEYMYTPPARLFSDTTPPSSHVTEDEQKYLPKVFNNIKTDQQPQLQHSSSSAAFIKNNYENLLNYHPSISQYIRNPSSILNAQPTFIQSGSSLVPVIILRVDGARPIDSQQSSNINLKSLLQQYITKYAGSQIAAQNYEYDDRKIPVANDNYNLLNDLNQFTQALRRYSSNTDAASAIPSSRLRLADHPLNHNESRYIPKTSYDVSESRADSNESSRSKNDGKVKKPHKVKSVEIISGPHIPSYHES